MFHSKFSVIFSNRFISTLYVSIFWNQDVYRATSKIDFKGKVTMLLSLFCSTICSIHTFISNTYKQLFEPFLGMWFFGIHMTEFISKDVVPSISFIINLYSRSASFVTTSTLTSTTTSSTSTASSTSTWRACLWSRGWCGGSQGGGGDKEADRL